MSLGLEQVYLYRMIHLENIPHILQYGITHKNSPNANPNFIAIGDTRLIDTRSTKRIIVDNGDSANNETTTIILGDFIPFYFGLRMPMLYVIQNGGNFVEQPTPAEDIIYLVCALNSVVNLNGIYYFTDGHATDNFTTFYDKSKINELPTILNWDAIKTSYWAGQENLNIKREKQAEFLVLGDLPTSCLVGFGCYNEVAKDRLVAMGIEENKIKVLPKSYF